MAKVITTAKKVVEVVTYICDKCKKPFDKEYYLTECPICHDQFCNSCRDLKSTGINKYEYGNTTLYVCEKCLKLTEDIVNRIKKYEKERDATINKITKTYAELDKLAGGEL